MSTYTLRIGPLSFVTALDRGVTEALGHGLETVGGVVVPSDRRPGAWSLSVPVRAVGARAFDDGHALRRQVRAFFRNARALAEPQWFSWAADRDLDGWLMIGSGDLEQADGGPTFAEWQLALRDCFRIGSPATVREAVTVRALDRRLRTTPRDTRRIVFSTDFAASPATAEVALPVGAVDLTTYGALPALASRPTRDGSVTVASGVIHGQTVSFERDEEYMGLGGVWIYDRRGATDPADWEAVFGPDQPLAPGDVPVLDNGIARVRWDDECLALDAWDGTAWEERGRVPVGTLLSTSVVEWTPHRAVVGIVATDAAGQRAQTYMTLQAGWLGPLVERYATSAGVRFVNAQAAAAMFVQPAASGPVVAVGQPLADGTVASFTAENWAVLMTDAADVLAVVVASSGSRRGADSAVYGATRSYVELPGVGFASVRFALRTALPHVASITDPFSTDTTAAYEHTGSGITISGGVLTGAVGALRAEPQMLIHRATEGLDSAVGLKMTTGSSTLLLAYTCLVLRADGDGSYIEAGWERGSRPHLAINVWIDGVKARFAQVDTAAVVNSSSYWLVARTNGDAVSLALWSTDPARGGSATATVAYTLSSAEYAELPAGAGQSGISFASGGVGWTYDDFYAQSSAPPPTVPVAASALADCRPQTVLVERA